LPDYHRYRVPGGCYFFTVNLLERFPNDTLILHVDLLRAVVRDVRRRWPFVIDGWVVLPDHLHCIWTLPPGDFDFTNRWRLIKAGFARQLPKIEWRSHVRTTRGERGIWQRRFWGHVIRDERDYASHMDYLHFNPVKHGYARRVADWPYSSFHRCVERGIYPLNWGGADEDVDAVVGERG
jgi:putative transposase